MKKRFARIIAVMLCAVTILVMTPVAVLASEGYTYNYDWWGDVQYSPDAYSVSYTHLTLPTKRIV